jgi:hypothetical protein
MVVYCLSWSMVGTGFLALAAAPSLALAALAAAWAGIFTPLANVSMDTHIARVIPADCLARVYTLQRVTVACWPCSKSAPPDPARRPRSAARHEPQPYEIYRTAAAPSPPNPLLALPFPAGRPGGRARALVSALISR